MYTPNKQMTMRGWGHGYLRLRYVPLLALLLLWVLQNNLFPRTWRFEGIRANYSSGQVFAVPAGPVLHSPITGEAFISDYTHVEVRRISDKSLLQSIPAREISAVAISASQERLATSGQDQHVRVWNIADATLIQDLQHNDPKNNYNREVRSIVFSSDEEYLASAGGDITKLWRVADGVLLHTFERVGARALTFSPDSQVLVAADNAQTSMPTGQWYALRFWDVASGTETRTILVKNQPTSLAFSPDGQWLAVGFQGGQFFSGWVGVWRVHDDDPAPTYRFDRSQWVFAVAWSPDGHHLAAGGASIADEGFLNLTPSWLRGPQRLAVWYMDGPFRGWQAQSIWTWQQASSTLAFTPDSRHLVSGGYGSFKVFRCVPLPLPPWLLFWSSVVISVGVWLRMKWRLPGAATV
jgi:WD40 repeat protein